MNNQKGKDEGYKPPPGQFLFNRAKRPSEIFKDCDDLRDACAYLDDFDMGDEKFSI